VKTLRIAIEYISHLQKVLANDEKISSLGNVTSHQEQSNNQRIGHTDSEFHPEFDGDDDDDDRDEYDDLDDDDDDDISTTSQSYSTWSRNR